MSALSLGLWTGLAAAFLQSCSYLGGRRFLAHAGDAKQLLTASIFISGVIAWLLTPFFWNPDTMWSFRMLGYVVFSDAGFFLGQFSFFLAQKHIESSRIASLLGMKVFVVMLLSILIIGTKFTFFQYVAGGGTALAAMLMNWEKGRLNWNGMGALTLALLGYAVSDVGIQLVVREVAAPDPMEGGMAGFVLTYGLMGFLSLVGMPLFKVRWKMIPAALPQALCWTSSMWGLYICFGLLGAAFGNVIQASRGMISLLLGLGLSFFCVSGLEQRHSWLTWCRRGIAALLMFAAIALFALAPKA